MAHTLLITGTLAPRAIHAAMQSADTTVIEFDTLLDRSRYPKISRWSSLIDLISTEEGLAINESAESLVDAFLSHELPVENLPTQRAFRAACLGSQAWRLTIPALLNLRLAQHAIQQFKPDRIIVAAGTGIHFAAWRQAASVAQIKIQFLPAEKIRISLLRRLWKEWQRWKKPAAATLADVKTPEQTQQIGGILCISGRTARIIATQNQDLHLPISGLEATDLSLTSTAQTSELKERYQQWWKDWLAKYQSKLGQTETGELYLDLIKSIGGHFITKIYPSYAALRVHARQRLEKIRPQFVLCDTQVGTPERMWSLAAQELGIPVVGYNYDQMPAPKFSFMPDFILADSGRANRTFIQHGIPVDRILQIQSHRKLRLSNPPKQPPSKTRRPLIIYADIYYAGTRADMDPGASYRNYKQVIETALRLPEFDFAIKFHPLRERKQEQFSFVGLDETELHLRKAFIKDLNPPANLKCVHPEISLPKYMTQADVLLNSTSTAGIEAFEMGIPVIFLQKIGPHVKAYPSIHDYQACLEALTPEDIAQQITRLIQDPAFRVDQIEKQQRYLREFFWPPGPSLVEGIETIRQKIIAAAPATT
ncbi:MAG: hypothetical protein OJI67_22215 [Prosthecobacter sp.]|nr:hypothetical protein [Prosthecobacter sp.]